MIRHQDVGMEKESMEFLIMRQSFLILLVIRIVSKDRLPLIAANDHVIKGAGKVNPGRPSHRRLVASQGNLSIY